MNSLHQTENSCTWNVTFKLQTKLTVHFNQREKWATCWACCWACMVWCCGESLSGVWWVAECVWCVTAHVWCVAECVCGVTGVSLSIGCGVLLSVCRITGVSLSVSPSGCGVSLSMWCVTEHVWCVAEHVWCGAVVCHWVCEVSRWVCMVWQMHFNSRALLQRSCSVLENQPSSNRHIIVNSTGLYYILVKWSTFEPD